MPVSRNPTIPRTDAVFRRPRSSLEKDMTAHRIGATRRRVVLWLGALLLFAAVPASAQRTARVRGTVVEAGTGEPIPGATVTAAGTQARVLTNPRGSFTLELPAGTYTVGAARTGYDAQSREVTLSEGRTAEVRLELRAESLQMVGLVVTATKTGGFGARSGITIEEVSRGVQVVDDAALAVSGVRSVADALQAVPSATVARSRVGDGRSGTLRVRGFAAYLMRNGIRQRYYQDVDESALYNIGRKGPSGVLYGPAGVGGIVSILTKQPTNSLAGSVALTCGSFRQRMVTVDVGGPVAARPACA